MCTLFVARVAQISNLRLALVGHRSHKNLDGGMHRHVEVKRLSEFLSIRAGDFGRTRPLSVSAFPRVDSSMAFERRDDRADCVRYTVNRVGRRR